MYIFAVALEDGGWHHVDSYAPERATRADTVALWHKITTTEDPEWTRRYHASDPRAEGVRGPRRRSRSTTARWSSRMTRGRRRPPPGRPSVRPGATTSRSSARWPPGWSTDADQRAFPGRRAAPSLLGSRRPGRADRRSRRAISSTPSARRKDCSDALRDDHARRAKRRASASARQRPAAALPRRHQPADRRADRGARVRRLLRLGCGALGAISACPTSDSPRRPRWPTRSARSPHATDLPDARRRRHRLRRADERRPHDPDPRGRRPGRLSPRGPGQPQAVRPPRRQDRGPTRRWRSTDQGGGRRPGATPTS